MNKKGQFPPQLIAIIGAVLFLAIGLPIIISALHSATCSDEQNEIQSLKNEIANLNNQIVSCQGQISNLENQLLEKENISNQLEDCKQNLEDSQGELTNCESTKSYLPIFWIFNASLTKEWIIILNISLGISIISIFNIIRWIFPSKKKQRKEK